MKQLRRLIIGSMMVGIIFANFTLHAASCDDICKLYCTSDWCGAFLFYDDDDMSMCPCMCHEEGCPLSTS